MGVRTPEPLSLYYIYVWMKCSIPACYRGAVGVLVYLPEPQRGSSRTPAYN